MPFEMFLIIYGGYKFGAWLDGMYPNKNNWYSLAMTLLAVVLAMVYIIRRIQKLTK